MISGRQTWVDYTKGIAIILVLYRHVFEGIKNAGISVTGYKILEYANVLLFSFRMPLFFIVSGIFVSESLKKRGIIGFISTKARTILYPYFLWGVMQISIQIILSDYVNANRTFSDYLYLLYLPRQVEQFWYLYALFNVTVLYIFFKNIIGLGVSVNILIGLLFFYISSLVSQNEISLGFVSDILHYYLFFAIGDFISKVIRGNNSRNLFGDWKTSAILFFPFIISQFYFLFENMKHSDNNYFYVEDYRPFLFIVIALFGVSFIMSLSFYFQYLKYFIWLQFLGKYSLYIYVAHVIALAGTRIFMTRILGVYNVPTLLICGIFMGLILPILLYKISLKYNFTWIFSLENTKPDN